MPLDDCEEQNLYFNKERILRWLRWARGKKDIHPDIQANEQKEREQNRRSFLRWLTRKTS